VRPPRRQARRSGVTYRYGRLLSSPRAWGGCTFTRIKRLTCGQSHKSSWGFLGLLLVVALSRRPRCYTRPVGSKYSAQLQMPRRTRVAASLSSRRAKLLSPTAIAQADEACGTLAIGPFRRLTARLRGPKLCLSPQPHRVRHELRPPALATPARHPGGLPIASSTRAPSSGIHRRKAMSGAPRRRLAPLLPTRRLTPFLHPGIAEPPGDRSSPKGRVAACRGRTKPLRWFPAAPLQPKSLTYATRKYTFFILIACVLVF
jgi:hypothetical protein